MLVHCPDCGTVPLDLDDVTLTIFRDPEGRPTGLAAYAFVCPGCREDTVVTTDRHTTGLLIAAGVRVVSAPDPRDRHPSAYRRRPPRHPEAPPSGPPFTPDDVLDLHEALAADDWFETFLAAGRRG